MTTPILEGAIIPMAKGSEVAEARLHGTDVSYTEADRHIEAYVWNGNLYIGKVSPLPARGAV